MRARVLAGGVLLLGLALPAGAYSGVGRRAVERALGSVPATLDDLEQELDAGKDRAAGSPEAAWKAAVLLLNRPKGFGTDEARRYLAMAITAEPGREEALSLWLDLVPREGELRDMVRAMRGRLDGASEGPEGAAVWWVLAVTEHRLGNGEEGNRSAGRAARLDGRYQGRAALLAAMVAGEAKKDERATEEFERALGALDDATAETLWGLSVLVASPEEIGRYEETPREERAEFFRSFWKRRDVFPLTPQNERLGEHFRRLERALSDYALGSNARGYLTSHDVFKEWSPDLRFYSSDVVFDYQERMSLWLDHRGLVYVRHGEPDRLVRSAEGSRAETWLYVSQSQKPLMFHFIDRRSLGEFVLTLNLAQAMTMGTTDDDPQQVLQSAGNFKSLYGSRAFLHPLFQRVAMSRSRSEIENLLVQEAVLMAGFLREAWYDDTNNLVDKDHRLSFAAYGANFRGPGGTVDAYVYYAIPEKLLKNPGGPLEFEAALILYTANWAERVASGTHRFRYERPPGSRPPDEDDVLVGMVELHGIEPDRYSYAFQVTERNTGRIGIAKGKFSADYYGEDWVELSDLVIARDVRPADKTPLFERKGTSITPIPTRLLDRTRPAKLYYEIYNLQPDAQGAYRYRVEYRLLEIQQEASLGEKVLGLGMNIAGLFFPYEVFLTRVGLFGLDLASTDPKRGLDLKFEQRTATPGAHGLELETKPVAVPARPGEGPRKQAEVPGSTERVVFPGDGSTVETFDIDVKKYPKGIYQAYVTVTDLVSGAVSTRSVRFSVTD